MNTTSMNQEDRLHEIDRRQGQRFVFTVPPALHTDQVEDLRLINLSPTGAEFLLPEGQVPRVGDEITGYLPLPAGIEGVNFSARVIWVSSQETRRCGVSFCKMPETEQMVIQAYIDYLERDKVIYDFKKVVNNYISCVKTLVELYNAKSNASKEMLERRQVKYLH